MKLMAYGANDDSKAVRCFPGFTLKMIESRDAVIRTVVDFHWRDNQSRMVLLIKDCYRSLFEFFELISCPKFKKSGQIR